MGQSGVLRTDSLYALLFVPIGVGVMQYFDLLRASLAR